MRNENPINSISQRNDGNAIKQIYFYATAFPKTRNIRPLRTIVIIPGVGEPGRSGRCRDRYMEVTGLLRFDIVANPIV